MLDILARLSLGVFGFLMCVFLYVAFLVPIMSRVGKLLYPEGNEYGQIPLGFLALVMLSICGVAIWVLGNWLFGILQGAI